MRAARSDVQLREALAAADRHSAVQIAIAMLAHEVNNPLGALLLDAELMPRVWREAATVLDVHFASDPSFTLANLEYAEVRTSIPALLTRSHGSLVRIGEAVAGLRRRLQPPPRKHEAVDLALLLPEALALVAERAQVSFAGAPAVTLLADPIALHQALHHVLRNACEAGAQNLEVRAVPQPEQHAVAVEIVDDGAGIAAADLARVTEPFFTTRPGALGIGLSIAAAVARAQQGALEVTSAGAGTMVRLVLPLSGGAT